MIAAERQNSVTKVVPKTKEQVSDKDGISHPRGVTRGAKFPVATLFVAEGTHDNVASDGFAADFLTDGEFERFCEQKNV